jgi:hypothetical protein
MSRTQKHHGSVRIFAIAVTGVLLGLLSYGVCLTQSSEWLVGAQGYEKALHQRTQGDTPLFLYFSVDWCKYCQQFKGEILSDPAVQDYLGSFIKVSVNPEQGDPEKTLFTQLGGTGYPTVLIVPSGRQDPNEVHVSMKRQLVWELENNEWVPRRLTPAAFISACENAQTY